MQEERSLRRDGGSDGVSVIRSGSGRVRRSAEELRDAASATRNGKTDLFVYGTLLSDKHVKLILGRAVETETAVLNN